MRVLKSVLCFGLVLALTVTGAADEKQGKGKKGAKAPAATQRFVNGIDLTDAQKEQVAALDKKLADEFTALNKERTSILTETQRTAERDAQKSAKAAGKTPAETRKSVEEALKLTEEQKTKMAEVQKKQAAFAAKTIEELKKILTPEQQQKLPQQRQPKQNKKKKTE
jgi:Spy/CpxP family protein refolding chaperone